MLALAIEFTGDPVGTRAFQWSPLCDGPSWPPWRKPRFGGYSGGETPGPIPNPEVKPSSADGTALETGWESRSPPRLLRTRAAFGRLCSLWGNGLGKARGPQGGWGPASAARTLDARPVGR